MSLDGVDVGEELAIVLESSVFVPAEVHPESTDHRHLGVAVRTLIVE